jgi:hypothetical protein
MLRKLLIEQIEGRILFSLVPFGATASDTAEYMLGDVSQQIGDVKRSIRDGLDWWSEMLARQTSVHSLDFQIDFTYTDQPISTGYEPIARSSNDFPLWIEDFFDEVGLASNRPFSERIRQFNHAQRLSHQTHWAFSIFVVNAAKDDDQRFDPAGEFSQAFAFPGGQFFVLTSTRPASSVAHETGHMFWAMDEYEGSRSYFERRGYYDTQNLNAVDSHPNPSQRVRSIMDQQGIAFSQYALSPSAREMIGWKDTDGDGIFDVLDVPLAIDGQFSWDGSSRVAVTGSASVQTLANQNPEGTGNDITLNRVDRIEYRFDDGDWKLGQSFGEYHVQFSFSVDLPAAGAEWFELRAVDTTTGVSSAALRWAIEQPAGNPWYNPILPRDVNNDGAISPIDALLIINDLNRHGSRLLADRPGGSPFLDVNGDRHVSAIDALLIINRLNESPLEFVPAARAGDQTDETEHESRDLNGVELIDLALAMEDADPCDDKQAKSARWFSVTSAGHARRLG